MWHLAPKGAQDRFVAEQRMTAATFLAHFVSYSVSITLILPAQCLFKQPASSSAILEESSWLRLRSNICLRACIRAVNQAWRRFQRWIRRRSMLPAYNVSYSHFHIITSLFRFRHTFNVRQPTHKHTHTHTHTHTHKPKCTARAGKMLLWKDLFNFIKRVFLRR